MTDAPPVVLVPVSTVVPLAPPVLKANVFAYLFMVVGVMLVSVLAIIAITLARPKQDNTALITSVIGMATPTVAALLALIKSGETARAVQEVHVSLNSRLTQLLAQTALAERTAGRNEAIAAAVVLPPPIPPPPPS